MRQMRLPEFANSLSCVPAHIAGENCPRRRLPKPIFSAISFFASTGSAGFQPASRRGRA